MSRAQTKESTDKGFTPFCLKSIDTVVSLGILMLGDNCYDISHYRRQEDRHMNREIEGDREGYKNSGDHLLKALLCS